MKRVLTALLAFWGSAVFAETAPPLHQVPLQMAEGQSLPLGSQIRFEIKTSNIDKILTRLQDWQHVKGVKVADNIAQVVVQESPQYSGEAKTKHLASSFVIDFDEPQVEAMVEQFKSTQQAGELQLSDIERFVSGYIDDPTYVHNFSIASKVATTRSGDCTEYAVLTAALARALGIHSRVVLGTVIMEEEGEVRSFGHAWVESFKANKWHTLDAALFPSQSSRVFYLPSDTLENEGPGFTMSIITGISQMPSSIQNLANVAAE